VGPSFCARRATLAQHGRSFVERCRDWATEVCSGRKRLNGESNVGIIWRHA
jgi:hypothetical protein